MTLLCGMALFGAMAGIANAIPIEFDIAGAPSSSVTLSDENGWGWADASVDLVDDLDNVIFSLGDGQSHTFDFFDITIYGVFGEVSADVLATLAFDAPPDNSVIGSGHGWGLTLMGFLSAGGLSWSDMPQRLTLDTGDYFDVDFEDICEWGLGNTTTVSATITAHAGPGTAAVPVPEPSTVLLLGAGIFGLAAYALKRCSRRPKRSGR